jgi:cytidylate kinase
MPGPLITVTRQYGSGGSEIARRVAGTLGWTVIDNEFVDQVARRAGLPPEQVAAQEERAPGLLERLARTLAVASPEMFVTTAGVPRAEDDEGAIVRITERIIADAAADGRVVLVGRGAQAILAQRPEALHIYVVAARAWRARVAVQRLGIDPAEVGRVLDATDRQRDRYVKEHYGRIREDPTNYDLVLNTERLTIDGAAALVVAEVRRRGWG